MNQQERVLQYLRQHKAITSLDGLKLSPPVIRVTNRIGELIEAGVPIKKEMVKTKDSHYMKYSLKNVD